MQTRVMESNCQSGGVTRVTRELLIFARSTLTPSGATLIMWSTPIP